MTVKERKKQLKSRARAAVIYSCLFLCGAAPIAMRAYEDSTRQEEMIDATEDVLRFRIDDIEEDMDYVNIVSVEKSDLTSLGTYFVTAYCACGECTDGDGLTALNKPPVEGRTVAVDPKVIPYGTVLVINGHEYIAEDSGTGWIEGKELDIYFDSHEVADEFGEQWMEVFVKEDINGSN